MILSEFYLAIAHIKIYTHIIELFFSFLMVLFSLNQIYIEKVILKFLVYKSQKH